MANSLYPRAVAKRVKRLLINDSGMGVAGESGRRTLFSIVSKFGYIYKDP